MSQAKMTHVRTEARKSKGAINGTGVNPQAQAQTQEQNSQKQPNQEQPAKC